MPTHYEPAGKPPLWYILGVALVVIVAFVCILIGMALPSDQEPVETETVTVTHVEIIPPPPE